MPTIRKLDLTCRLQCSPALVRKMLDHGPRDAAELDDGTLDLASMRRWIRLYRRDAGVLFARLARLVVERPRAGPHPTRKSADERLDD